MPSVRIALLVPLFACLWLNGVQATGKGAAVTVVSGTLEHHVIGDELFRIDGLWMKVASDTAFHRWLSQGIDRHVSITLTPNPDRSEDVDSSRILSGTLMHGTAPNPTPNRVDVVGSLPEGNLQAVHVLYLKDELTGSFGPITFETSDRATAKKFDVYDGADVSIVIAIK